MGRAGDVTRRRLLRDAAALGVSGALAGAFPAGAGAARKRKSAPTVAVFGGGVAGMTTAHELAERGFDVRLFERKALGGKARSIPVAGTASGGRADLPAEHGFRAVFSFYQNLPDTMRRIPFRGNQNGVFDNLVGVSQAQLARAGGEDLTGPIAMDALAHYDPVKVWESLFAGLKLAGGIPPDQLAFFARQVAMFFTSGEARRYGQWEYVNWFDYTRAADMSEDYRKQLADGLTRNLAAAKPQDMSVNSTGIVGESFAYALGYRPDGPSDRILNAPTNEAWIDPWIDRLRAFGVRLKVGFDLVKWEYRGGRIAGAVVKDRKGRRHTIEADYYVSAIPVERARRLFTKQMVSSAPELERLARVRTEWMNGVIFHLDREVPVADGHVSYVDSEFALTSISQAQHWARDVAREYGDGRAKESFSTIISDWNRPGMLYGKPASACTRDQVIAEVWAQLKAHLNDTGRTVLSDDMIVSAWVDPAIAWPAKLAGRAKITTNEEPLLINTPGSWDDRPATRTAIPNLMLAGDYVRNTMNVATMESASETGRRAAQAIVEASGSKRDKVQIYDRWQPPENQPFREEDDARYKRGDAHVLDFPWPVTSGQLLPRDARPEDLRALLPREAQLALSR